MHINLDENKIYGILLVKQIEECQQILSIWIKSLLFIPTI